jgi:hypothetical protein
MAYGLEAFCKDAGAVLGRDAGLADQGAVVPLVRKLLADEAFLAATFPSDLPLGVRTIWRDPALGFCVLAHNYGHRPQGMPHDHGETWAIYGQADRFTDMVEWRRTDGGEVPGKATIEKVRAYRVEPGQAYHYGPRVVHSVGWPLGAKLVRVTGADLGALPRRRFDPDAGTVSEGADVTAGPAARST